MGNEKSQPVSVFEYTEKIAYFHRSNIYLHDIDKKINIQNKEFDNVSAFRSYDSVSSGFIDRNNHIIGCDEKNLYAVAIVHNGASYNFIVGTFDKHLKNIKNNMFSSCKKFSVKDDLIDVLQSYMKITFGHYSVENKLGFNETVAFVDKPLKLDITLRLPYEGYLVKREKFRDLYTPSPIKGKNQIHDICYDKHEDNVIMMMLRSSTDADFLAVFEVWKKIKNEWVIQRVSSVSFPKEIRFRTDYKTYISYHLECGRRYFLVALCDMTLLTAPSKIYIFNKYTFELCNEFNGYHPTFFIDGYEEWYKNSLETIKKIEVLSRMSTDVLSLILSFAG